MGAADTTVNYKTFRGSIAAVIKAVLIWTGLIYLP
jgi:hypothetical protein